MAQGFNAHGDLAHHTLDERLMVNETLQVSQAQRLRSYDHPVSAVRMRGLYFIVVKSTMGVFHHITTLKITMSFIIEFFH